MHYIVWWIKLLENESKTIINFPVSAWNVDLRVLLLVVVTTGIVVSQIANRIDRRTSTIVVSPGETEHHGHTPHIAFDNHVPCTCTCTPFDFLCEYAHMPVHC